jgi:hypothetical protein
MLNYENLKAVPCDIVAFCARMCSLNVLCFLSVSVLVVVVVEIVLLLSLLKLASKGFLSPLVSSSSTPIASKTNQVCKRHH